MSSTIETGHTKNVANFEQLISFCKGYGAAYNPSKLTLNTAQLDAKLAAAKTILSGVRQSETAFNNITNTRMQAFKPLRPLATQLVNALDATDASAETVKDARTINRKLQGQRAVPKETASAGAGPATTPADKTISASQQSFDQQIAHFSKLVQLLESDTNYQPNEAHLKTPELQAKLVTLQTANTAVINAYTTWSNDRIQRDNLLYNPVVGIKKTGEDVKFYIKSVFGASSPQYKQVSGIAFKQVPK
ncbi:MAG: hypothetical protein WDN26_07140 [Chitinophagaceae bacterium]